MAESTRPPAPTSNLALSPLKALRICREVYIEADQPFPKAKIPATKAAYTAQFARISSPQLRRWFYAYKTLLPPVALTRIHLTYSRWKCGSIFCRLRCRRHQPDASVALV